MPNESTFESHKQHIHRGGGGGANGAAPKECFPLRVVSGDAVCGSLSQHNTLTEGKKDTTPEAEGSPPNVYQVLYAEPVYRTM